MTFDPDAYLATNNDFNPDQYLASGGNEEVKQEMPSFLSWKDRAVLKNFSNSPNASLKYLQQKYPDKQFKLDESGEVMARGASSESWGMLDPQTGVTGGLMELARDAGDIAYDVVGGGLQGAATTAGTIGGLPGAAAASSASGTGIEAIRQGIGKAAGIPQEINNEDLAWTAGIGAASPLLLGAGSNTKGLIQQGAKKLGSVATRVPVKHMDTFAAAPAKFKALNQGGLVKYLDDVGNLGKQTTQSLGKGVQDAMVQANKSVDIRDVQKPYLEAIRRFESGQYVNNSEKEALKKIAADYSDNFMVDDLAKLPYQSAPDAFSMQQSLKDTAQFHRNPVKGDMVKKTVVDNAQSGYMNMNTALDKATDGLSTQAKQKYANWKTIEEAMPDLDDPQKIYNSLTNLDSDTKVILKQRLEQLAKDEGVDFLSPANDLGTYKSFYGNWKDNLKRQAPLATLGASLGTYAGYKQGGGYAGAGVGGATGAAIGAGLAHPASLRGLLKANKYLGNKTDAVTGLGGKIDPEAYKRFVAPAINEWLMLLNEDEAK